MHEFVEWPKTKRLFRDIVVTEKLDGTNSAVHITAVPHDEPGEIVVYPGDWTSPVVDGVRYVVSAQSRKRIIYPGKTTDNYGFAAWVYDNAADLVRILGEGVHFGEWWGRGIQRGYGLDGKRFSLFNTDRWFKVDPDDPHGLDSMSTRAELSSLAGKIGPVPVLYAGSFSEARILSSLSTLAETGSVAAPGFMNPEGVCVYHTQTRDVTKVTLDANDAGKWEAAA
ncbi:RNA ligase family protein [Streptomyces sp. NPDC005813]|uniref:RNA ligase family protein n=1 Tax=Streptomyces sp. NPDC005813 TaxID=3155592 RepID=UPI0033D5E474